MLANQDSDIAIREIVYRTRGHTRGPITRLVSPSDLGELIKPFVFLDHFDLRRAGTRRCRWTCGWHPHSGIATVTVVLDGAVRFAETTGKAGVAAGGKRRVDARRQRRLAHRAPRAGAVRGFQLWVALPPELENAPIASHYVMPDEVPTVGPARVILGRVRRREEPDRGAADDLPRGDLKAGERWTYQPADGTRRSRGSPSTEGAAGRRRAIAAGEVAIFEPSEARDRLRRRGRHAVRARFGGEASARPRARQLLGAHERRGAAARRGGDSPHRPAAARRRHAAAADLTAARAAPASPVQNPGDHHASPTGSLRAPARSPIS